VVIAGGGDSAVDWTLSLADVAAKVMVVHRRDKFRAAPETVRQMKELADAGKVEMVVPYQLDGLEGANGQITARHLQDARRHAQAAGSRRAAGVSSALAMNLGPIAQWGLNLDQNHIKVDPATLASSAPGIFAIGDIARYPGKLKLILTASPRPPPRRTPSTRYCTRARCCTSNIRRPKGVPGS